MPQFFNSVIVPTMLDRILSKIDRRLVALDLAESKAATEAGLSDSAIRNIRRAVKDGKHQGVSVLTIMALAPVLKTTPEWLISDEAPDEDDQPSWLCSIQQAVRLARIQGASPEDIRKEIVRIAPLPGIEVALDPPKPDRHPRTPREFGESSAAQLNIDENLRTGNNPSRDKK